MPSDTRQHSPARFVLLGVGGTMTRAASQRLIELDAIPVSVVQAGPPTVALASLPGVDLDLSAGDWRSRMAQRGIDSHHESEVVASHGDLAGFLHRQKADLLLVACWPRRLPLSVLEACRLGAVNLHPSLLPDFPGPDPVGDMLREGARPFGVSLHCMTEIIDGGPLIAQRPLDLSKAKPDRELVEISAARLGAELFVQQVLQSPAFTCRR